MNLAELLQKEILRPFITLALPGFCATWPYVLVLVHYHPSVADFWQGNVGTALLLFASVALTVGLLLEDIGCRIESGVWDRRLERRTEQRHHAEWKKYLALTLEHEPIAQGYLRSILMHLKFELGLGLALPIMWCGLLWLHLIENLWAPPFFCVVTVAVAVLMGYLFWESYASAELLSDTRKLVLDAASSRADSGRRSQPETSRRG